MERGVVKIASDVKLVLCLMQEESERLKEATPFWIVEKILWVLILATLEECIHAKYGNPGVSSSWRHTGSDKQTHSKPFTVTLSKGEGQLYHIHVHVLSDKHSYICMYMYCLINTVICMYMYCQIYTRTCTIRCTHICTVRYTCTLLYTDTIQDKNLQNS